MHRAQGWLFDMDGTLLNSEVVAVDAWEQVFRENGMEVSRGFIAGGAGLGVQEAQTRLAEHLGLPCEALESLRIRRQQLSRERIAREGVQPRAGIPELLHTLRRMGRRMAVCTSSSREYAKPLLESNGLLKYFDVFLCGDECPRYKPNPDIFLIAAQRLGLSPEKCVVLEDAPAGLEAARRAGMPAILVPDQAPIPEPMPGGVLRFSSHAEVAAWLRREN